MHQLRKAERTLERSLNYESSAVDSLKRKLANSERDADAARKSLVEAQSSSEDKVRDVQHKVSKWYAEVSATDKRIRDRCESLDAEFRVAEDQNIGLEQDVTQFEEL